MFFSEIHDKNFTKTQITPLNKLWHNMQRTAVQVNTSDGKVHENINRSILAF